MSVPDETYEQMMGFDGFYPEKMVREWLSWWDDGGRFRDEPEPKLPLMQFLARDWLRLRENNRVLAEESYRMNDAYVKARNDLAAAREENERLREEVTEWSNRAWDARAENERLGGMFAKAREGLVDAIRAHNEEADASNDDGSPVGIARYHRALARGISEALVILDYVALAPPAQEEK